jgi:hypothetical protein
VHTWGTHFTLLNYEKDPVLFYIKYFFRLWNHLHKRRCAADRQTVYTGNVPPPSACLHAFDNDLEKCYDEQSNMETQYIKIEYMYTFK